MVFPSLAVAFLYLATRISHVSCADESVAIQGVGYEGCVAAKGGDFTTSSSLILGDCSDELNSRWVVEQVSDGAVRFHANSNNSICLQATHTGDLVDGAWLRMYPCSAESTLLQDFVVENDGYIKPASRPDLCVVYEGVTPQIGKDRIILKDCGIVASHEENGVEKKWAIVSSSVDSRIETETIFLDPNDRRVLFIEDSDGTELTFFGTKDAMGNVLSVDELTRQAQDKTTVVRFDSEGRPVSILAEDGSLIAIIWTSETTMTVSYTTGDGSDQAIIGIDLASLDDGDRKLHQTPSHHHQVAANHLRRHLQSTSGSTTIELLRCNTEPITDTVVELGVQLTAANGESRQDTYMAYHIGNGMYKVDFLLRYANIEEQSLLDACKDVAQTLGVLCDGMEAIPLGSETAICALIASRLGNLAGHAFVACEAAFVAGRLACLTVGASPSVPGSTNALEYLCGAGSVLSQPPPFEAERVTLTPNVRYPPNVEIASQDAPASGPFPTFSEQSVGGNAPEVVSFTIDPWDPAPGQDYIGTAEVTCASTSIALTVVGTDNYSDQVTCDVLATDDATTECGFLVPGAAAGVYDDVTLYVDGEPFRAIGVTF